MKVSYLIDTSENNECSVSSSEAIETYQRMKIEAEKNYIKRTHQKMQKSTIFLKEAIVNLQEHHTLKDLEPIKEKLESYGFTVLQMAIHKDEGFLKGDEKKKNYHAHITMLNVDIETGRTVKFGKNYRTELSKLQTFTAQTLGMERGKVSVKEHAKELNVGVEKASKRLDTHEYKHAMKIKEQAVQTQEYNFRKMQKEITALEQLTTEQKKELHRLNSRVKNHKAEVSELQEKMRELENREPEVVERVVRVRDRSEEDRLREKLERAEQEKKKLTSTNEMKVSELQEKMRELENREPEVVERVVRVRDTGEEDRLRRKLKELEQERAEQEKREKNFRRAFDDLERRYADMQKELIEARESTKALKTSNDTLKSKISSYERDMKRLSRDVYSSLKDENGKEKKYVDIVTEYYEHYKIAKTENAKLKKENKELKSTITNLKFDIHMMKENVGDGEIKGLGRQQQQERER